jgi:hypothetical protein
MVVACIAVVLAMTGSAFAARALITGADIKDGSISRADLSSRTVKSLKGKRGPAGRAGRDGFVGAQGPQGSTGPEGPRGLVGPAGPQGQKGTTGDTGARGAKGDQGEQGVQGNPGDPGPQGTPGQSLVFNTTFASADAGTPLTLASTGPDNTEGAEISNGGTSLSTGSQYKVDVFVSFVDPNAADAGLEYGVGRLFLDGEALNTTSNTFGGFADVDTTIVTPDVPDDTNNPGQATGSFLVTPGDNGGGQTLTLRGAVRTDEPDGANVAATVIVTRIG